jgi:hypothetical protein
MIFHIIRFWIIIPIGLFITFSHQQTTDSGGIPPVIVPPPPPALPPPPPATFPLPPPTAPPPVPPVESSPTIPPPPTNTIAGIDPSAAPIQTTSSPPPPPPDSSNNNNSYSASPFTSPLAMGLYFMAIIIIFVGIHVWRRSAIQRDTQDENREQMRERRAYNDVDYGTDDLVVLGENEVLPPPLYSKQAPDTHITIPMSEYPPSFTSTDFLYEDMVSVSVTTNSDSLPLSHLLTRNSIQHDRMSSEAVVSEAESVSPIERLFRQPSTGSRRQDMDSETVLNSSGQSQQGPGLNIGNL